MCEDVLQSGTGKIWLDVRNWRDFFCLKLYLSFLLAGLRELIWVGKETHGPKTHLSLFRCGLVEASPKNSLE